ncbi:MAG: hypothetical protein U1E65_20790 [Myxococcota bacterium]
MNLEPGVTYYVESDADDTVLLALDVKRTAHGIEWFDTVRDRVFRPLELEDTAEALKFRTAAGPTYTLRKLTAELYTKRVAGKVDGHRAFVDTEALQRFYRQYPR